MGARTLLTKSVKRVTTIVLQLTLRAAGRIAILSQADAARQALVVDAPGVARYRIQEYVRWEDIDAAGIINYQAYLRFFALAEAEMLREAGLSYRFLFESLGIWLPRVRVECQFYRPAKLDELLSVEAYSSRIGNRSLHLDFEVRRHEEPDLVASGKYILVCVRQKDFVPVPVPEEIRSRIRRFHEDSFQP